MTTVVIGYFRDGNKSGGIAQENSTQRIQKEITTPVVIGNFRDRNKTGMVFTRQKSRSGANPESSPITQPKKIYVKYALPVRQYSHRNIMKYFFNKLFNTLRIWRVKIFIIMLLI